MKKWLLMVLSSLFAVVLVVNSLADELSDAGIKNQAQPSVLADYLREAALHNPGLEAAFNKWKAEVERITQVRTLPDPRFNFAYYIEEVETKVGPQEQGFGFYQTIPWFGKLKLRGAAATEQAEAAHQQYEATKLALFEKVKSAYYDYWFLGQAINITRQNIELVRNMEAVARSRFKAGVVDHASVIQAQVELGKLNDRLNAQKAMRNPLSANLNALLNRDINTILPWPKQIPLAKISISDAEAIQLLTQSNPQLSRLDHLARKEDAAQRLAKRDYYPDVTFGVDYVMTGDALNPDTIDNGKDPLIAKVSINLPIWFGKYRAAEREAVLRKTAIVNSRADASNQLLAQLKLALYRYHDAQRKIDLYANTLIPKAEESLQVTQQSFEAGKASFIDLIDAQRSLLEFQLSHKRALSDSARQLAVIERLINRSVESKRSEKQKQ